MVAVILADHATVPGGQGHPRGQAEAGLCLEGDGIAVKGGAADLIGCVYPGHRHERGRRTIAAGALPAG